MQPVVIGIKQLNIAPQVNMLSARLTVLLRLENTGTSLVTFWMFFCEDALIVQVREVAFQVLTIWKLLLNFMRLP